MKKQILTYVAMGLGLGSLMGCDSDARIKQLESTIPGPAKMGK